MRSFKVVDWRNPEGLIEIDLEEKGWGDGRTVSLLYDGRSPMISRGDYCLFVPSFVKPMLCKYSNKQ